MRGTEHILFFDVSQKINLWNGMRVFRAFIVRMSDLRAPRENNFFQQRVML